MLCCFCMWFMIGVFFFKQKTAYEMRISDWSSDVCSSDLRCSHPLGTIPISRWCRHEAVRDGVAPRRKPVDREPGSLAQQRGGVGICVPVVEQRERRRCERHDRVRAGCARRSEEHTSELQSLMRISYAVFCLKKKKDSSIEHSTN